MKDVNNSLTRHRNGHNYNTKHKNDLKRPTPKTENASKLPISVDRVGIENQAIEAETESPPINNQGLDHAGTTGSRTARYEDAKFISPLPVHVNLNRNRPDGRETANSDRSSGDVIPANGRTAPCEDVQIISPPSVHEMPNQNRPDERELERANSDRISAYVIPANGRTSLYRVVQIAPPSAVHNEHSRNRPDGIETRNSDCSSGYEEVQTLSLPGYTQLDRN
ncbi:Hypothetical predicted protein [Paramuricea clavata]|uniref:Uncharacterized protein n=1 Tax=Paramuricea clavata TaxID=317549 RepID=A0A7D9HQH8_PARCT|nr:Hypothetical predicted protein [Paramuricea clavata]